jgi:hypothetical protein
MFNSEAEAGLPLTPHQSIADPPSAASQKPSLIYDVALYKPGTAARWQGMPETVSHVLLRRGELKVFLQGHPDALDPAAIEVKPTRLYLQRN